jgi:hypothetical protein
MLSTRLESVNVVLRKLLKFWKCELQNRLYMDLRNTQLLRLHIRKDARRMADLMLAYVCRQVSMGNLGLPSLCSSAQKCLERKDATHQVPLYNDERFVSILWMALYWQWPIVVRRCLILRLSDCEGSGEPGIVWMDVNPVWPFTFRSNLDCISSKERLPWQSKIIFSARIGTGMFQKPPSSLDQLQIKPKMGLC